MTQDVVDPQALPPAGVSTRRARLREVAALFTWLGFTAFGGPAAHAAMMEDEVVRRRRWLDRGHFLDLIGALNFIPGPNSTELAIHLGLIRAGLPGLVVAGVCFITPAMLIVLVLAWAYVHFGRMPQVQGILEGVNPAVIAVLGVAFWRFAKTGIRDGFTLVIGIAAALLAWLFPESKTHIQIELIILAAAAICGALWAGRPLINLRFPLLALAPWPEFGRMFLFFLKIGVTLFGSGYVLVSYLQSGLVARNWMTDQQILDAVSIGQVTPGPLLTTATFIGYVLGVKFSGGSIAAGVVGGILATVAIFSPSFVLVALFGRVLPALRRNRYARGALDGMNAAVAALILVVTLKLAQATILSGGFHVFEAVLIVGAFIALLAWNVGTTRLIMITGALGWLKFSILHHGP